ncbi:Transcriptional regulatory protein LevR, contains PRD, AAA+ and EIIA domains [Alkalibacterium putridalgicola]|uniref:Transcription antiterminator BglG n=1 Tax=Alkalibacterium putridalgicola TaxID=426703 RepID=A0A1H7XK99_9LACT|nr:sigma-54-dependent transcriptional regulator [Alkalibacterium putridalgicola]GEK88704.1 transcription antiterminator BglG [Alkalibacterium putridalgicola]SEM34095.1 Transcriptional regulatory protein LevR, contains PRD, AAA+ and EIIA domains [Alkalibacterium putridalgicola]
MNRKQRVLNYVNEACASFTHQDIEKGMGITTKEVADALESIRSNISKDLNQLAREGQLKKIDGRPVRFIPIEKARHKPLTRHVSSYKEKSLPSVGVTQEVLDYSYNQTRDIFKSIIGANGSIKNAVEQAKAAVLYPPKGLNTLITGPTGSGKSFFAHAMFRFAQSQELIDNEKELVVFNCADYASNPQLLMSYLFGYAQGAFTGAASSTEGLIQQADGGMLFLDEVHRLPPEGQEMVFYFMDTGMYSRLGETGKNRHANVRIVCATTEDPKSTFLDTFMRRIPINIHLPSFKERPVSEQLDLVKLLTGLEANRIQRKIILNEEVVKGLIASVGYGNVGQLKSSIQLVCARGFMNQLNKDEISLTVKDLPETIKDHLVGLSSNRLEQADLSKYVEAKMMIDPNEPFYKMAMDSYELPYNIYDIIGDKAALLEAEGLDQDSINQYISTDINVHLKSFYRNHGFSFQTESKLAEVVSKEVIQFAHQIVGEVELALGGSFKQNFIYAMSLHISSLLSKISSGQERIINNRIREMAMTYANEYAVAERVKTKIAVYFDVDIPDNEVYYLTVLLVSLKEELASGRVGIVIATHGNSTASSMARVAEQLLDTSGVAAIDMPLDMSPTVVYERIKKAVLDVNEGSGVLLLVDMGSLATFETTLQKETGIHIRSIDMVSTAIVLEAVRKASLVDADIELLYESLTKFSGYTKELPRHDDQRQPSKRKPPIVMAVCASGEGTAQKIKEIIEKALRKSNESGIQVKTCSVTELDTRISEWQKDYTIIASTGIVNPKIQAPFIPLERFIEDKPEHLLKKFVSMTTVEPEDALADDEQAKAIIYSYIEENFAFINPQKVVPIIWSFVSQCEELRTETTNQYAFHINLAFHMAGLIERLLQKDKVRLDREEKRETLSHPLYSELQKVIRGFEKSIQLTVPLEEYGYILYFITKEEGNMEDIDTLLTE